MPVGGGQPARIAQRSQNTAIQDHKKEARPALLDHSYTFANAIQEHSDLEHNDLGQLSA